MSSTSATATSTTSSQPQTLTLPASTIATLSPHPYLLNHLQRNPSIRPNGRKPSSFRQPSCNTSSLSHCFGSAVVRTGETAVACGIQGEILYAKDTADPPLREQQLASEGQDHDREEGEDTPEDDQDLELLNLLVPNIDLATGCSPAHLPGGPPSNEAQTLAHRLYRLLLSSRLVRLSDLRIMAPIPPDPDVLDAGDDSSSSPTVSRPKVKVIAYWTLYITLSVLSLSGTTSLLDSLWAALLAALTDLRLPHAVWNPDLEYVLCSDAAEEAHKLRLRGRPIVASWGVFEGRREDGYMRQKGQGQLSNDSTMEMEDGHEFLDAGKELENGRRRAWLLADPDTFEEALCCEKVTVVVDRSDPRQTKLLRVEKIGGGVIGMEELMQLLEAAEARWKVWNDVLPPSSV